MFGFVTVCVGVGILYAIVIVSADLRFAYSDTYFSRTLNRSQFIYLNRVRGLGFVLGSQALILLNRSVRVHPEHTASWVALGLLNERNKRVDEARACFETATKTDPGNAYAWLVSQTWMSLMVVMIDNSR